MSERTSNYNNLGQLDPCFFSFYILQKKNYFFDTKLQKTVPTVPTVPFVNKLFILILFIYLFKMINGNKIYKMYIKKMTQKRTTKWDSYPKMGQLSQKWDSLIKIFIVFFEKQPNFTQFSLNFRSNSKKLGSFYPQF